MKNPWKWVAVLFLLLALPALACQLVTGGERGQGDAGDDQGALGEGNGAEAVQSTEDQPGGGAPAFSELRALDQNLERFNTFHVQMRIEVNSVGEDPQSGSMTLSTQRAIEPPASRTTMQVVGNLGQGLADLPAGAEIVFAEVEGRSFFLLPGFGCVSGGEAQAAAPTEQFGDLLDTREVVGEVTNGQFVDEEVVYGQATYHYIFDQDDLRQSAGGLREVSGDVYVAKEDRYIVRMIVDGVGELGGLGNELEGEGNVSLQYDVLAVGQPLSIEVPEECGSAGSDYPVMEGATDLSSFEGLTTYSVNASLEDVVSFYQQQMAAAGYQSDSDPVMMEGLVILSFTAPDRPGVSVTLTEEAGGVNVLITSGDS